MRAGSWQKFVSLLVWTGLSLPLLIMIGQAITGHLGPDPAKALVDSSGLWTIRLLWLTLAMTPLRIITGMNGWVRYRRRLGLGALFYACIHLSCYAVFFLEGEWVALVREIVKRPYIVVGFMAWLLLLPLGLTSTRQWQRKLGHNWLRLHKAVYLIAFLALIHFIWLKKLGIWAVWPYALLLLVMMALRTPVIKRAIQSARINK
ncbi:sulfoxide reductase heme-binding subunit YedZ [Fluviicoccus keumensis]|uniref:Protein-methionine-sulfoxide reductase heme-binding subunit MsrQ n=1 Tax=Fluviicoccus keumensis TaxID=1435465 RepID=A0A4V2G6D6_9GAMM|nr:protein-methionine-sulfoxide reductase heme-binding subunit MsrQ [Fluviicoccus keumensis]RZU48286.1 sulfoxide reductase heme-binding subunit YedZ [Fluviicoccus keumensis]